MLNTGYAPIQIQAGYFLCTFHVAAVPNLIHKVGLY